MTNTGHDTSTAELPDGWRLVALKDVAEVRLGRQRSPKNHSGVQMRPYLRAANVTWAGLDLDDVKEMNFTDEEMSTYVLRPGDILVNEASGSPGEVGKAAVFDGEVAECAFQNTLIRVRPTAVGTDFLHLLLTYNALSGAYLKEARGVGIAHIGKSNLAAWPTAVPSAAEQERIVEVLEAQLSRLDAALGHVQTLREKAAQFRRSLLHAAFTGALTGHDTSTGELPDGWSLCLLDEVNDPDRPICYGILKPGPDTPGGIPYVKVKNIKFERVLLDGLQRTTPEIEAKYARSRLRTGDLLVSIRGTYGRTAVVPSELEGGNITQDSARIAPVGIGSRFVFRYLQSPPAQDFFRSVARGVAVKGVNIRDLRQLPVPVPGPGEQERIVEVLEAQLSRLDAALAVADEVEERASALRRSLLHAAFTGKLTEKWREENRV